MRDRDRMHVSTFNFLQAAWVLYADIVCINYGGSIFDAALLALVAALQNGG